MGANRLLVAGSSGIVATPKNHSDAPEHPKKVRCEASPARRYMSICKIALSLFGPLLWLGLVVAAGLVGADRSSPATLLVSGVVAGIASGLLWRKYPFAAEGREQNRTDSHDLDHDDAK